MLNEIIKKNDFNLTLKQKKLFSPPKIKSSNLKGKQYPYDGIL